MPTLYLNILNKQTIFIFFFHFCCFWGRRKIGKRREKSKRKETKKIKIEIVFPLENASKGANVTKRSIREEWGCWLEHKASPNQAATATSDYAESAVLSVVQLSLMRAHEAARWFIQSTTCFLISPPLHWLQYVRIDIIIFMLEANCNYYNTNLTDSLSLTLSRSVRIPITSAAPLNTQRMREKPPLCNRKLKISEIKLNDGAKMYFHMLGWENGIIKGD